MPQAIVNPRIGRKRRQTPRNTTWKRRALSLYVTKQDIAQRLLQDEMKFIRRRIIALLVATIVFLTRIRSLRTSEQDDEESIARLDRLAGLTTVFAALYQQKCLALRNKDELLCDIPLEEENEAYYKHPKGGQRIE